MTRTRAKALALELGRPGTLGLSGAPTEKILVELVSGAARPGDFSKVICMGPEARESLT